ncbi:MAG: 4Fe-4S binding protein [Deltaproteobacteria bacterium]|nr:4Fe-4S binding protein [Deltaproteobacteria bacterium]
MAAAHGVDAPHDRLKGTVEDNPENRFLDESACILCGLCVRTCEEIVGASAIAFEGRGIARRAVSPFRADNEACIACGACEFVCPTRCIGFHDRGGERELERWRKRTKMIACRECGDYFLPESLAAAYKKRMNIPEEIYTLCPNCRKSVFA